MTSSWVPAAVVAALSLGAFAYTASSLPATKRSATVSAWQSYCAFEYEHIWALGEKTPPRVVEVIRPSDIARTVHLFPKAGELYAWDTSNGDQYTLESGGAAPATVVSCLGFESGGYRFELADDAISACKEDGNCYSIQIREGTFPYVYAEQAGGIFVATNFGDALLFRGGEWCRMVRSRDEWRCPDVAAPVKDTPSNQFYSSLSYQGRTLLGEYPTGQLYQFDGKSVALAEIPQPPSLQHTWEAQSLAFYCGELYVGYWPTGEVHRFDGKAWQPALPLFSHEEPYPFTEVAEQAGLAPNFFGHRVQSLVPFAGSLYAAASSKSAWYKNTPVDIGADALEYGLIHRIWKPGCRTAHLR